MSTVVRCYQLNQSEFTHLFSSQLIYLFSLFNEHDYSIRLVGGAVRDILLGVTPHDIDLATTATTNDMLKLIQGDSNIELVYTRAEHFGTLTLIVGTTVKKTFQITTLKRSIIRHGKNVHVEFTDDWNIDAQQRDLSINSLSMDEYGMIYDYINGIDDLKNNRIRFNGDIVSRLQENPIRILRYFRLDF
jgi:tRNA nucleotidyltransferase (CCA-adding enzyme)